MTTTKTYLIQDEPKPYLIFVTDGLICGWQRDVNNKGTQFFFENEDCDAFDFSIFTNCTLA